MWLLVKLVFLLRGAPYVLELEALESFDMSIRSCAGAICNTIIDYSGWLQAKLSVRLGGLGLGSVFDISLSAYLLLSYVALSSRKFFQHTSNMTALIDLTL